MTTFELILVVAGAFSLTNAIFHLLDKLEGR